MIDGYAIAISPSDTRAPILVTRLGQGGESHLPIGRHTTDAIAEAILADQGVVRGAVFLSQWFARELLGDVDPAREGVVTLGGETVRTWLNTWRDVIEPGQGQAGTC